MINKSFNSMDRKQSKSPSLIVDQRENLREHLQQRSMVDLIDMAIEKIIKTHLEKHLQLDDDAKIQVRSMFINLFSSLASPRFSSTINDLDSRFIQWKKVDDKMKPNDDKREEIKTVARKSKKKKLNMNVDKFLASLKSINMQVDPQVVLYMLGLVEYIIYSYMNVCWDYQKRVVDDKDTLRSSTIKLIFSKYKLMDCELDNLEVYSIIRKLTHPFSNYKERMADVVPFLKACISQIDIVLKVFHEPLLGGTCSAEHPLMKLFMKLDNLMDINVYVAETLEDNLMSSNTARNPLGLSLSKFVSVSTFQPWLQYCDEITEQLHYCDMIESILNDKANVQSILEHYNKMVELIIDNRSTRRKQELLGKYHLIHSCVACSTDYSDSNSAAPTQAVLCNLLINSYRYLLPRLVTYPLYQLLYLYHIVLQMSQFQPTSDLDNIEKHYLRHTQHDLQAITNICNKQLQHLPPLVFKQNLLTLRTSETLRLVTKESNDKINEISCSIKKKSDRTDLRTQLMGNATFIMEGNVQIQIVTSTVGSAAASVVASQSVTSSVVPASPSGATSIPPSDSRYMYLFDKILLICKSASNTPSSNSHYHSAESTSSMIASLSNAALITSSSSGPHYYPEDGQNGSYHKLKLKKKIHLKQFWIEDCQSEASNEFILHYAEPISESQSQSPSMSSVQRHPTASSDLVSLISGVTSERSGSIFGDLAGDLISASGAARISSIVIGCASYDLKCDWISSLVNIQTGRLFAQYSTLKTDENIPLILPEPDVYQFAEPDSELNIIYEKPQADNSSDIPVVRAATLPKLICHLTHHQFSDTKTLSHFLLIFRQFTTAPRVLNLLLDRFNVPDPTYDSSNSTIQSQQYLQQLQKRFITGYKRKVQLRVVNFIAKWTSFLHHRFYEHDFLGLDADPSLLIQLKDFLNTASEQPHLAQKVRIMQNQIDHRPESRLNNPNHSYQPAVREFLSVVGWEDISILDIHPVELARQITLVEWRLYSMIEFWELHGRETTREPNYVNMCNFSNKVLYWLVLEIVRLSNLQDRCCAMMRVIDLMQAFESINNLQGVQECKAALISASVYRLKDTFDAVYKYKNYRPVLDRLHNEAVGGPPDSDTTSQSSAATSSLTSIQTNAPPSSGGDSTSSSSGDSYFLQYHRKIHAIAPPAVPYIAMGDKTRLIHMHLRHPSFITPATQLDESSQHNQMINFFKFRQMAELIDHFLSFQKVPYNLQPVPFIQRFLNNQLDPFKFLQVTDQYQFDHKVHRISLEIQPKALQPPSFDSNSLITATPYGSETSVVQAATAAVPSGLTNRQMSVEQQHFSAWLNSLSFEEKNNQTICYKPPSNDINIPDPPERLSQQPPPIPNRPSQHHNDSPPSENAVPPPIPSRSIPTPSSLSQQQQSTSPNSPDGTTSLFNPSNIRYSPNPLPSIRSISPSIRASNLLPPLPRKQSLNSHDNQ